MNIKGKKGITLIALVITIVILIILAGVVISLSFGENGILNRAKEARQKYEIAEAKEYIEMKIDRCTIDKDGNASMQDIVDYLAEDSNVTYYVALEEIALVAGEVDIGTPKEIYVVYNRYQFKIEENKNVEFISIVDVDLEGQVTIEANVQEYLGKNEEGNYTARVLLKATGEAEIAKLEIQNPDGTILKLLPDGLTTVGKDMTIEFDKEYKVILTTENGHKYTKKIIERAEETIMTAEELASFRDRVNSGLTYEGKIVKLGADIDLSTVCGENVNGEKISWKPIGYYNSADDYCYFEGTFDGKNYEISNLYINEEANFRGLFGVIMNAKMQNVIVKDGYINAENSENIAGIVGHANKSVIEKCKNGADVFGKIRAAGIVGYNQNGVVRMCSNNGSIVGKHSAGGIAGKINEETTIDSCYNSGNVSTRNNGSFNRLYLAGGIASYASCPGGSIISNCYNIGNIYGYSDTAGIIAHTEGGGKLSIINNYTTGKLTGNGISAILNTNSKYLGNYTTLEYNNNYWLKGCGASYGYSSSNTNATPVSDSVLKSYASTLGDAFTDDIKNEDGTWKYNDGYPILKWQLKEN